MNIYTSVDDFCDGRDESMYIDSLKLALFAKFTQNKSFKNILLNTKNAKLYHKEKNKWVLFKELMIVRECIRNFDKKYDLEKISQFSHKAIIKILKYPLNKLFWAEDKELIKSKGGKILKGTITGRLHLPDTKTAYNILFDNGTYKEFVPSEYVFQKI